MSEMWIQVETWKIETIASFYYKIYNLLILFQEDLIMKDNYTKEEIEEVVLKVNSEVSKNITEL